MAIAGASRYLGAATLANTQGISAQQSTLIGNIGAVDLLDVARSGSRDNGIGLSGNARALNKSFLSSTADTFNQIFSLGVAATSSIEGLQTQIAALRASLPEGSLSREVRGLVADGEVTETASSDSDAGSVVDGEVSETAASDTGTIVDTEA